MPHGRQDATFNFLYLSRYAKLGPENDYHINETIRQLKEVLSGSDIQSTKDEEINAAKR